MESLNEIIKKLIAGEGLDDPNTLSNYLISFTARLYEIDKAVTEAEIAYATKWEEERSNYQSDKRCDMAMKKTQEWKEMENKKSAAKMSLELLRSLKRRLGVLETQAKSNYY